MTDEQMKDFKTSIIGEVRDIIVEITGDIRDDIKDIRDDIKDIRDDIEGVKNDVLKLQIQLEEESIKNRELFNEVFARFDSLDEVLPPMARRLESLEREVILLKMAVFGKESVMGQV